MPAGRSQSASMHDQHRAQPLAHRRDDELLERFLRRALDHAVHIEMRLHGELAAAKLRHESRVQSDAVALDVLVRLGDIERRLFRYQVGSSAITSASSSTIV